MGDNKFIIKLIVKGFTLICMIFLAKFIFPSYGTIFTNEMALTQMQSSNEAYILMDAYAKLVPLAKFIYSCVMVWITAAIVFDTHKFVKTNNSANCVNTTNEKEN